MNISIACIILPPSHSSRRWCPHPLPVHPSAALPPWQHWLALPWRHEPARGRRCPMPVPQRKGHSRTFLLFTRGSRPCHSCRLGRPSSPSLPPWPANSDDVNMTSLGHLICIEVFIHQAATLFIKYVRVLQMFNESMMILYRDYYAILHYNARDASDSSLCGGDDIQEAHVCFFLHIMCMSMICGASHYILNFYCYAFVAWPMAEYAPLLSGSRV
jgi:hypothetical protein